MGFTKAISLAVGIVMIVPVVLILVARSLASYEFNNSCAIHLQRAANASSIDLASGEIKQAVMFIEKHKMTEGNTGVILKLSS